MSLYQSVNTPGNDNGFAVYNAVQCTDVQWPTSWAVWSKDNHRVNAIAPFETWANAWFNAPCLHWPAPAARQAPMQINGTGFVPWAQAYPIRRGGRMHTRGGRAGRIHAPSHGQPARTVRTRPSCGRIYQLD